jgi:hypothetical protein
MIRLIIKVNEKNNADSNPNRIAWYLLEIIVFEDIAGNSPVFLFKFLLMLRPNQDGNSYFYLKKSAEVGTVFIAQTIL